MDFLHVYWCKFCTWIVCVGEKKVCMMYKEKVMQMVSALDTWDILLDSNGKLCVNVHAYQRFSVVTSDIVVICGVIILCCNPEVALW